MKLEKFCSACMMIPRIRITRLRGLNTFRLPNRSVKFLTTLQASLLILLVLQLAVDRTLPSTWLHIMRKPSLRKRALITMGTTFFIQCSGILVVNNYGTSLSINNDEKM